MLADKLIKELAKNKQWFRVKKNEAGETVEVPAPMGGAIIHHGYWKRSFETERPELDINLFDLLTKEVPRQNFGFNNSETLKCQFFDFGHIPWCPGKPEQMAEAEASQEGFELGLLQLPYPICFFYWVEPAVPDTSTERVRILGQWAEYPAAFDEEAEMGLLLFQPNCDGYSPVNIVATGMGKEGTWCLPVVSFVLQDGAIQVFGKDKMEYTGSEPGRTETYESFAQKSVQFLMVMLGRLNAEGIAKETVYPPEKVNRKRRQRGQPEKVKYTTVRVAPYRMPLGHSGPRGVTFNPPRYHLRRGHVRRFKNGNSTWVRHCFVGDPSGASVEHDYVVGN